MKQTCPNSMYASCENNHSFRRHSGDYTTAIVFSSSEQDSKIFKSALSTFHDTKLMPRGLRIQQKWLLCILITFRSAIIKHFHIRETVIRLKCMNQKLFSNYFEFVMRPYIAVSLSHYIFKDS